jgi:lincosamide nucleotidyltransferase A/C/D/E
VRNRNTMHEENDASKAIGHGLDTKVEAQTDMKAQDVVELVQFLERNHIEVWLDGGWGVDALLEEQTREHKDLDLVVVLSGVPRMQTLLGERGFRLVEGGSPMSLVLAGEKGRHIDVHPVTWDEQGNGIYRMRNGQDWVYPASGFAGSGSVLGQRVRCLTAETQMLCHTGYELSEKDFREMDALHQRFGVEYPPEYRRQPTGDQA